ncbi:hypothetical protein M9458_053543, partial [Cirrhinus mrigala]
TLPPRVLDLLTESYAPSAKRLDIDPESCPVLDVLRFLQHRLDNVSLPSMQKVYVADIASFHSSVDGQTIGMYTLVVRFLRGAMRLHPPRPPSMLLWDLALVLKALSLPP